MSKKLIQMYRSSHKVRLSVYFCAFTMSIFCVMYGLCSMDSPPPTVYRLATKAFCTPDLAPCPHIEDPDTDTFDPYAPYEDENGTRWA